jgi:4-amino-4-deoxy-L-arabinose transferase-like glycosyltransferase
MDAAQYSPARLFFRTHFPILFLIAAYATLAFVVITDLNIYTPDSTRYLVWAQGLASFRGLIDNTLPDPSRYVVHAPLYPLLLVPAIWFSTHGVIAAKLMTIACGIAALIVCYTWLRLRTGNSLAAIASFLLACNPMFLLFSTEVLSDVPFALCCAAILLISEKLSGALTLRSLLAFSLILSAGILLRQIGVTLVAAVAAFLFYRRRWKEALVVTIIPAIIYALWFVRNEVIVAHRELPAITNSLLMTAHFFTPADTGILEEWMARAVANGAIYGKLVAKLIFLPLHGWVPMLSIRAVFCRFERISVAAYRSWGHARRSSQGCFVDFRDSATAPLRALFAIAYCLAILVYPVNDIRFMLPVLLLILYYFVLGVSSLSFARIRSAGRASVFGVLVLVSIPNLCWGVEYARNCAAYNASPAAFFDSTRGLSKYPSHFTKPFHLVGEWFSRETPPSALILTQWKDVVVWSDGRKVLPADQTVPLDEFESLIRDYGVTHLMSVVQKNGAREFDMQMHATMRYAFTLKTTVANVEVYAVSPKSPPSRTVDESTPFRLGMTLLLTGSYERAREVLANARGTDTLNMPMRFAAAVAEEFLMNMEPAKNAFTALSSMPQSLMFAREANHRQMIESG